MGCIAKQPSVSLPEGASVASPSVARSLFQGSQQGSVTPSGAAPQPATVQPGSSTQGVFGSVTATTNSAVTGIKPQVGGLFGQQQKAGLGFTLGTGPSSPTISQREVKPAQPDQSQGLFQQGSSQSQGLFQQGGSQSPFSFGGSSANQPGGRPPSSGPAAAQTTFTFGGQSSTGLFYLD